MFPIEQVRMRKTKNMKDNEKSCTIWELYIILNSTKNDLSNPYAFSKNHPFH